jgi:Na+/H+-dicarboxylate symporter
MDREATARRNGRGVVLPEAIDVIPDIFKTLANTTGSMTVSTVLSRWSGGTAGREADPGTP